MDQLNLFATTEQNAFEFLQPKLNKTLEENWIHEAPLTLERRKGYYSIIFNSSVVVRLCAEKNPYISLPDQGYDLPNGKKKAGYIVLKMNDLSEVIDYENYILKNLQILIDRVPTDFSCCSRYLECSNMQACTHPDYDKALRCGYRKALHSGKVFYGENRNI